MTPFKVDPSWYEDHWLREQPETRRPLLLRGMIAAAQRLARVVLSARATHAPSGAAAPAHGRA
jgi:hypothetical protein